MMKSDNDKNLRWNKKSCDNKVDFGGSFNDPNFYSLNWNFIPVEGKMNVYNIVGKDATCGRMALSVARGCGQTYVDLFQVTDEYQQFKISVSANGGYNISSIGRTCDKIHMSTGAQWNNLQLTSSTDSLSESWSIQQCVNEVIAPIEMPGDRKSVV